MCGLAGQFCYGDHRASPDILRNMLVAQQVRGKDSSGVAWLDPKDGISFAKRNVSPQNFVSMSLRDQDWRDIAASPIVLMHARHATQGSPTKEVNNHPVIAADWVVTHNGHVHNDDDLVDYYGMFLERPAEVDTVAINLALAQGETVEESLAHVSQLDGAATFFAWNLNRPDEVVLARVNGPNLFVHLDTQNKILFWSSDVDGLKYTYRPRLGKIPFSTVTAFPQDSALILSRNGIKHYELNHKPFAMPKPLPDPKPVKQLAAPTSPIRQKETPARGGNPLVILATNLTEFVAQAKHGLETATLEVSGTTSNGPIIPATSTDSEPVRPSLVDKAMNGIFNALNGDKGARYLLFSKDQTIQIKEDYQKELRKPHPEFLNGMVSLAFYPPGNGSLITPYGTWFLTQHHQWFRGAKRVKEWWAELTKKNGMNIMLPGTKHIYAVLDNTQPLERLSVGLVKDKLQDMLMCPWCGIISRPMVWRMWKGKCSWCGVTSVQRVTPGS